MIARGVRVRIRESNIEGVLISPMSGGTNTLYESGTERNMRVWALLLDSGEVKFVVDRYLEDISNPDN